MEHDRDRRAGLLIATPLLVAGGLLVVGDLLAGCAKDPGTIAGVRGRQPIERTPGMSGQAARIRPDGDWQQVASWSGQGFQNTNLFEITSRPPWRLSWDTPPEGPEFGMVQIFVYGEDGQVVTTASNMETRLPGHNWRLLEAGPGMFRLRIIASESTPWTVTVEEGQ